MLSMVRAYFYLVWSLPRLCEEGTAPAFILQMNMLRLRQVRVSAQGGRGPAGRNKPGSSPHPPASESQRLIPVTGLLRPG